MKLKEILSRDLETEWKDHFHMRDQMWKTVQYGILFFIGVIGFDLSVNNKELIILAYSALFLTSLVGYIVTSHLRRRQIEKFRIIVQIEKKIGIYDIIKDVIKESKIGFFGKIDTAFFIRFVHIVLMCISLLYILLIMFSDVNLNLAD